MAVPTGSGTELLRSGVINTQSSTVTTFKFATDWAPSTGTASYAVPSNHIITILSVLFTEQANAAETLIFYCIDGPTTNNIFLLEQQAVNAYETFAWNTKFVLITADKLAIKTGSAANVDVVYSFLDQDWT